MVMKKFLNIRNILIILIIIIAVAFICWGRSDNLKNSKAYQLFNHFYEYGPEYGHNENNTIMKLENIGDKEITWIYATDYDNEREVISYIGVSETSAETTQHSQLVNIISKKGRESYIMLDLDKICYKFDTIKEEATELYASWAEDIIDLIMNNTYYTRGYELVNGKLLYYENFKNEGLKFYFDNDNLVYMKSTKLEESFNLKDILYKVEIRYDDSYKEMINIPDDYEGYKQEYNEDTNETEKIKIEK